MLSLTDVGLIEALGVVMMLVLATPYVVAMSLVFWDVWKK